MKNPYRINVSIERSTRNDLRSWCDQNHQQMGWIIESLIKEFLTREETQNVKESP